MEGTTFADQRVQNTLNGFVFLKVDADSDANATQHYKVACLPTLVVLDGSGDEKYRHVGPMSASELDVVLSELNAQD